MNNNLKKGCVLAIGNFDGIHLGHRALMAEVFKQKERLNALGGVITFFPHPLAYLKGQTPPLLMAEEDKQEFFYKYMGIDRVSVLNFDENLANEPPADFLNRIISEYENVLHIVVGFDFTFGKFGKGDGEFLRDFCLCRGIGLSIIPAVCSEYGVVSSSSIREKLAQGDIIAANKMLGYWYNIKGCVEKGRQIGRTIGFHTANIAPDENRQLPPNGVYAARMEYKDNYYDGIVNLGCRPTVDKASKDVIMEAHLFMKNQPDFYNQELRVFFGNFIRAERRFKNLEELKGNIEANSETAKEFLKKIPPLAHLPKVIK